MDRIIKELLGDQCLINDSNIESILLEIPQLIDEKIESDDYKEVTDLMGIYLKACIYLGRYTKPYDTLKRLDDITAELNGEMYTGKYFSIAESKYYTVRTLGKAQQFYGKALTELLQAMNSHEKKIKIETGCQYFERSMELLKQLDKEHFNGKEHHVLNFYFTFLTLLSVLGRKEEFHHCFKDIFTWDLDFTGEFCHLILYKIEIMFLTLEKQYQTALSIYKRFFEKEDKSYISSIGVFILTCCEKTNNVREYERFLKKAYKIEREKYKNMDHTVLDSLLRNREKLTLDIYIGSFKQDFNVIGGKPAVYKFN